MVAPDGERTYEQHKSQRVNTPIDIQLEAVENLLTVKNQQSKQQQSNEESSSTSSVRLLILQCLKENNNQCSDLCMKQYVYQKKNQIEKSKSLDNNIHISRQKLIKDGIIQKSESDIYIKVDCIKVDCTPF